MSDFAEIVFPQPNRRTYTYSIPERLTGKIQTGMRVWVPLRGKKSIGMVVDLHDHTPAFEVKVIERLVDREPVLSEEMLNLTEWIHRFYYCGWGEAIQAALPSGLNFSAITYLKPGVNAEKGTLDAFEQQMLADLKDRSNPITYSEAQKRWKDIGQKQLNKLIKKEVLEIREEPRLPPEPKTVKGYKWAIADIDKYVSEMIDGEDPESLPKWINGLLLLKEMELPQSRGNLLDHPGINSYVLDRIEKEEIIHPIQLQPNDMKQYHEYDPEKIKELNTEQEQALEQILNSIQRKVFHPYVLYGITGSGKTEVYIHALKKVREQGRGALVLVPEISLTPQTVKRFYQIFGDDISVLHSRLNEREKYEAWNALRTGDKHIAIGPRSAVFAPVPNPGLIVIDEEHDGSYKQEDPAPRYHARDVAIKRANDCGASVLLGSATPSMQSLHRVKAGKATLLDLPSRHAGATLPDVKVLDLRQYRRAMKGPLAYPLHEAVESALMRGEQSILLYNRRGFANFIQCDGCGWMAECPHCSVTLTHHRRKNQLRCHYCGYSILKPKNCPSCNEPDPSDMGSGTQRVEEELHELFPEAGIIRMDQDTTRNKYDHEKLLSRFARKEANLLIGTQLITKGLDFPDVTVVGVVNSDTELAFPSYRSDERLFQMLAQVSGRSGRSDKPGKVYLQSRKPEHPPIQYAAHHDFKSFARQEFKMRKQLLYPPFSRLIRFDFRSPDEQVIARVADCISDILARQRPDLLCMGPAPAAIYRTKNAFNWELNIKVPVNWGARRIEEMLDSVMEAYEKEKPSNASRVRINVNVDAI